MTEPKQKPMDAESATQILQKMFQNERDSATDEVHTGGGSLSKRARALRYAIAAIERDAELLVALKQIADKHIVLSDCIMYGCSAHQALSYYREVIEIAEAAISSTGGES